MKAVFLPPNVTSLIQPIDQGFFEALKRRYQKFFLRDLLLSDDVDILEHLKSINILKVIKNISLAWKEIKQLTIQRSWRKFIPEAKKNGPGESENLPPSNLEFVADLLSLVTDCCYG